MPGMQCYVVDCPNRFKDTRVSDASYFSFPSDKNRSKIWIQFCKRDENFDPGNKRICSNHFDVNDFERDLMSELLNIPQKKRILKPNGNIEIA